MYLKRIYFIFGLLLFNLNSFSQTDVASIDLIHFNSTATYGPGSGVSVHINPTGIYKMGNPSALGNTDVSDNNKFVLLLDTATGDFSSPIVLAEIYDFYTPLINAILPDDLAVGDYKLRILATQGLDDFPNQTFSETYIETNIFSVTNDLVTEYLDIISGISSINNNFFYCYNESEGYSISRGDVNPVAGSLNRGSGATTSDGITPGVTQFSFASDTDNTYNVYLFDILNSGSLSQSLTTSSFFGQETIDLPQLSIGSYNIQIEEINSSGVSSFFSVTFLWHGNNTNLGNTTAEIICLLENVVFAIDTSMDGIGRNYPSSYYSFDFGDGTAGDIVYFTHAELMSSNIEVSHQYTMPSCDSGDGVQGSNFIISKILFNKIRTNSNDNCEFSENGLGVEKPVNVSQAPVASFDLTENQCEGQPITATNTTTLGQWGLGGSCLDDAFFNWYVKGPSDSPIPSFTLVPFSSGWIVGDNLVIPAEVVSPGCWEIYLLAYNQDLCQFISQAPTQTIGIEVSPQPDFDILQNGQLVTEICTDTSVLFEDSSNLLSLGCQNPVYQWTVSPSSGFTFINETSSNSQNPQIFFDAAGTYTITQTITNTCGTVSNSQDLLVEGAPSVGISSESAQICLDPIASLSYTIDFSTTYIPVYSDTPFAPSSYSWSIAGPDISASDYSFISGTDSSSPFPVIEFNSFKDYTIIISVDGDCEDTSSDQFLLIINEIPAITNTELIQTTCSGSFSDEVLLFSSMEVETTSYSWEVLADENFISGYSTPNSGNLIPSEQLVNSCNLTKNVIYRVTPSTEDCTGSPLDFIVVVNPTPVIPDQSSEICSGDEFFVSPLNSCPTTIVPLNTTYTWVVSSVDSGILGATDQSSEQTVISQVLINELDVVQFVTYSATPVSGDDGSCIGAPFDVVVTVNPKPIIDDITLAPICSGGGFTYDPTNNLDNVVPLNTTYNWTVSVSNSEALGYTTPSPPYPTSITQSNLTVEDEPVIFIYTVTPTSGDDGNCIGEPFDITIQVNPKPIISSVILDTICSGEGFTYDPANDPDNNLPSNTTYDWTVSVSNSEALGYTTPSPPYPTSITQSNLTVEDEPVIFIYTVTPTSGDDGNCVGEPFDITITVVPNPVVSITTPLSDTICIGGTIDAIEFAVTGGIGTQTNTWSGTGPDGYATTESGDTPWNPGDIFTAAGSYEFYVTVDFDGSGCNQSISETVTITVLEDPVLTDPSPLTQQICLDSSPECLVGTATGGGEDTYTFNWYLVGGSGVSLLSETAVTESSYCPPTDVVGTFEYYYTVTTDLSGCETTSLNAEVIVTPGPSIADQPLATQTVCKDGATIDLEVSYQDGIGDPTYQWYVSNVCDTTDLTNAITDATSSSYTPPSGDLGTFYYFAVLTFSQGGCDAIVSDCAEVIVTPNPVVSITTPLSDTICIGGTIDAIEFAVTGGIGTQTNTWSGTGPDGYATTESGDTPWNPGDIFTAAGSYEFYVTVDFDGSGCNQSISETVTITVLEDPVLTDPSPLTQQICLDSSPECLVGTATGGGEDTYTFNWYLVGGSGVSLLSETAVTESSYCPPTDVVGTFEYYYTVTTDLSGCETTSLNAEVIVTPGPSIADQPLATQTVCKDGATIDLEVSYQDGIGDPTYQWYVSNVCDTTDLTNAITDATSSSYTPPSGDLGTFYYFAVLTFSQGGCDAIVSDCAEVIVTPNPVVSITTPLSDTICIGGTIDAIEFAVTGGIGTQTNTWSGTGPDGYATTESGDTPWNPGDIFTAAGSYEFYVTVDFDGSGCNQSISETVTITVLEDPVLTDPSPLTQQICLDSSPECLVGTATGGGEDTYTFNWYLVGGSGVSLLSETAVTESSYCPPTDVVGTFEYYYTVTTDLSGCETTSLNAEVIVTPGPSIADQPLATQTVCKDGATIDLEVSYQDGIGDPTYQWYVSNVCDTTDLTNAITDATSSSYTPPSGDLGTFYYFAVLTFSQGGCDAIVSDCAEVIVTPNPVVSITTPLSDTICIGGTIDAIEFAVTGGIGTQTNTWSGTGPDGYATTESGDTPWNPGDIFTAAGSYEFYVTVDFDGSGCNQSISETVTITVLEDPVLTDPSPLTQQICLDSSPECLVGTATGGGEDTYTFNWYLVGGSGVSLLSETAVTESSYCPPTDVVGTFEYYYTVTTDLSGCETTSLNAEVIVTPGPSIADQPLATQTVCKDGATIDLEVSYQDGIGDPTYQWYVSNVCDTTDLTNAITDATSSSYTPPSGDLGTFYYFAVLTFSQGGCDAIVSDCAEVIVTPNPVVSITTPLSDTICIGGTIDAIEFAVTGGIGTQTNTWSGTGPDGYATTESGDTPWNPGDIFTAAGSYEFYVTVDFDGSGCNQSISETVTITVLEDPVLTDPSPLTQQICLDSSPECLVGTATGGGEDTYTFNWYLVGGSGVSLLSETAVTESSYCPPTDVVGTFEYYYTVTTDLSGCETTSLNAEVIVTPGPSIADQPLATQTVCKDGATIDLEVSYQDGIGDPTYQWYVSNVCDTTDLTNAITDATSSSYTPPSGDLGTFYYFAVLTFSQGGCDAIVSDCAEVIVTPNPVVSITTPLSDTICIGGTIDAIEFAVTGGIGTQTNTWSGTGPDGYATTESGDTPWNPGDIFTAAGSYEFYVTVDFDGSGCNQSISETVTITVLEDPVLTDPSPLTQQICLDSSPECLVGTATGGGEDTYTFNWYLVGGSGVSLLSETAVTESSYCPPTDVVGTFEYYYTVTTDLSGCETTSLNAEVIVTPGPSIADQPLATQTVCKDGATIDLEVSYQDGIGDPTYQWYVSNVCDTTDLTNAITDATSSSYTPPSGDLGTFYYFAVLTFSQGGCDAIVSDCAEVIVTPNPVVSITTPLSDTICIGGTIDAIEFAVTGGIGTQTNTWSGTGPDGYATTESGDTPWNPGDIFTAAGSYEFYVTVDFDGSGCNQSISETVTITVLEDPVLTDPSPLTQQICLDSSPECLVGTATGGGEDTYTFNWYLVGGSGVSLLSETAVTESSYCPPTDVVGTFEYYYTVTTDLSGCETTSLNAEVIVTPGPSIADQPLATQTVCKDGATIDLEVSYQDGIGDPTYQWYVSNVCDTTDLTNAITDATSSSYTPPSGDPGTFYYFAVLTFSQGGCDAIVSDCAEVIVKPVAEISDQVIDICDVSSYVLNPQDGLIPDLNTIVPSGTTYTWSFVDNTNIDGENSVSESLFPEGVGAPSVFDSGILDNVNPLYDVIETVEFNVTPWTDGCSGPPFTIIITISPEPEINAVVTNTECSYSDSLCGGSIEISTLGMVPFTYNWTSITPGVIISNPTEKDQFDLCPGIYMLNIIDSSGCSYDYEYEINQPVPINFNLVSLSGISCNNVNDPPCDGFIEVSFSGGTLPYTSIEWFGETAPGSGIFTVGPFTNTANPFQLFNACEGRYHLEVIDANGCQYISDPYIIEQLNTPIILSDTVSNFNGFNIDCNGANTGSISVNLDGGSETYNYSLLDSAATIIYQGTLNSAPASISFEFLTAGDYSLTISDPICPFDIVVPYTLTQPDPLSVSATLIDPINCFGGLATYNIAATGGVPPYTGTGFVQAPGGSITFTIYDSNGCSDVFTTTVPEPAELASTSLVTDALCFGDLGSLAITPNGGVGVLTVSLFDASLSPISNQLTTTGVAVQFNVLAGTYFYKIEDASGCETNPVVSVISEPQILEVTSVDITNLNCNLPPAFENGSICITIIGGTNPFPLGSGWVDNGGGNWCLTGLSEGTYPIDVTDQNGCPLSTIIPDIELTRPEEITAFFKETIDIDCTSNTAIQTNTIVVDGGIPPYEITWSGGVWDPLTQELMETSVSGNYTAFVNDQFGLANGCPPIAFPLDPIVFFEFGVSDFSLSSTNSDFCGVYAIGDPINFQNNSTGDIVDFTWNFGDGSLPISGVDALTHIYNLPGTYTIELALEDMYGCLDIFSETIKVTRGYEIILPTAFTPNGDGINETIRPVFNCITTLKMSIYDTFGSLLYEEKGNTINGWDGTINGNQAENGNYIIVVSAESFNGEVIELSGPITLIK